MDYKSTLVILGPTAVGKTEVSILLAERIGGEIISADAMQVYRGMDIATAKPTPSQRLRIPHHLIDVFSVEESYSVARFRALALDLIREIKQRGRQPVVVGGSGLYLKALVDGLFDSPPADWAFRRFLEKAEKKKGPGYLYRRLEELDPRAGEQIHPNDCKRVIRALEVLELTGLPMSSWRKEWGEEDRGIKNNKPEIRNPKSEVPNPQSPIPNPFLMVGLQRERADLYRRINARAEEMFRKGLVEETKRLLEQGADHNRVAWQALGYKEVEGALRGQYSLEEAHRRLARNTRHFAKRQLTWWRRDGRIRWVEIQPVDPIGKVLEKIMRILGEESRDGKKG